MSENETTTRRARPGRPRAEGVDERILRAALNQLARVGYDAMSIAAVAAEAGVTKPTLYRRWSSKEDLVTSAVSTLATTGPEEAASDGWEALLGELQAFHRAISRPQGIALVGNVLALEQRHPHLIELFRRKVASARRSRLRYVLNSAQSSGIIRPDADIEVVIDMLIGYYYSARVGGGAIDDGWPGRCIALIRQGLQQ